MKKDNSALTPEAFGVRLLVKTGIRAGDGTAQPVGTGTSPRETDPPPPPPTKTPVQAPGH